MRRILLGAVVALGALIAVPAGAEAATFTNSAPITINDSATANCLSPNQAKASTYPSQISVSNQLGNVSDVKITVNGLSHTHPSDVRMLLVGPHGQSTLLMANAGSSNVISNVKITFDDAAASMLPDPIVSGTFRPSQENGNCNFPATLDFPSPAPVHPYGPDLAGFNGSDPNGSWSLYVVDAYINDVGSIPGGWSLDLAGVSPATGQRAAALKACKKRAHKHHWSHKRLKKCKRKANLLPV